jgi:hypothetical protein
VVDAQRFISQSPTSLAWYQDIYPTLAPEQRPLECIQEPDQTIFVPGGWWHMVLNLNETIAVTQNFADDHNLEAVCEELIDLPRVSNNMVTIYIIYLICPILVVATF